MKHKIVHIITRVQKSGGAENNTLMTIRGLVEKGYEVVLMVGNDSDFDYAEKEAGCRVVKEPYLIRNINPFKDLMALLRIYKFIKSENFIIAHTHLAKAGILGRFAAYFAKTPIIIHSLHGITFHNGLNLFSKNMYLFLEKLAGRFTNVFISVGDDLKNRYIESGIGNPKNYFVIYSGINLDKFYSIDNLSKEEVKNLKNNFGLNENDVVVGMIASLEYRKGHRYALEAARRLIKDNPNLKFIFSGEGCLRKDLMSLAEEYGIYENVIFTGYIKEIEKIFSICDVVILTSLWEGLSQVLVQAATAGKPIVSFDVEGVMEIVSDGINGFIIPIKNIDALVDKVGYLISDLERAITMGRNGRMLIDGRWRIDKMISDTIEIYQREISKYR